MSLTTTRQVNELWVDGLLRWSGTGKRIPKEIKSLGKLKGVELKIYYVNENEVRTGG